MALYPGFVNITYLASTCSIHHPSLLVSWKEIVGYAQRQNVSLQRPSTCMGKFQSTGTCTSFSTNSYVLFSGTIEAIVQCSNDAIQREVVNK